MSQHGLKNLYVMRLKMMNEMKKWGYNRAKYVEELSTRLALRQEVFEEISDRDLFIVFHSFGFGYTPNLITLESIGNIFEISRQRVHFLRKRTIAKLKALVA